ncbi:lipase family protein [Veronia pacifica]|uniref:Fungal lipase-type domain-containing protein n=1 Tax=Veronia pacifica TaxID=1080227 RepID=A0A1C3EBN6_9GAMM|nr:lipase family protein [Veronia pacifica]ODA30638.1 hypothetical protein A8L45_19735 [Veronia pacifica]
MDIPAGCNIEVALELAALSEQTYLQLEAFQNGQTWQKPQGYHIKKVMMAEEQDGEVEVPIGFIATKGDNVYVCWRGTQTAEEWLDDLNVPQTRCDYLPGDLKVEEGFYQVYTGTPAASPQQVVREYLSKKVITGKLYVTGHSLGAAVAVLNIIDIAANTAQTHPVLYTFAGPRVGSPEFADYYNAQIEQSWRVVNSHELVPKVPLKDTFSYDYQHVNEEFDITFGEVWTLGDDHDLSNYITQLKKIKQATAVTPA